MSESKGKISVCVVVYNEEAVIEQCLKSIKGLADEIIIVHDGECKDNTLTIARKYTDKIFVREHVGMMEAHLVFALKQAHGEWVLRIDADEFIDQIDFQKIKKAIGEDATDGIIFKWEMWDGEKTIIFPGLQKMCLVRREHFHYCGIPHENGTVDGKVSKLDVFLHHRPTYNNISWSNFLRKSNKWIPVHASYYFPEKILFECFNNNAEEWKKHAGLVRKYLWLFLLLDPVKMVLGQLKNGLWKSKYGIMVVMERYIYFVRLYLEIYKIKKNLIAIK